MPRLLQIEEECFSTPWTAEDFYYHTTGNRLLLTAARADGGIIGYISLIHVLDEGHISNLAVDRGCRGQGVGRDLAHGLIRRAKQLGLSYLMLEVRKGNLPARKLYEKLGFSQVGRRPGYYRHPTEDAILMTLELVKYENTFL